jgi:predicted small lipoprotein YifL
VRGFSRNLLLALIGVSALAACGSAGPAALSDAEKVWCKPNETAVASAAMTLGLPHPNGFMSWQQWGTQAVAADSLHVDGWTSLLNAADLPNRDRACAAAYQAR